MSELSNPSQLIMRVSNHLDADNLLIFNNYADQLLTELLAETQIKSLTSFTSNFATHNHNKALASQSTHHIGPWLTCDTQFDCVLLFHPKSKKELFFNLENIFNNMSENGRVYVVGENKGGVKSLAKTLKDYPIEVNKLDSARHCSIFELTLTESFKPFNGEEWFTSYQVSIANQDLEIYALPGVFSQQALDIGTKLLLETIEKTRFKGTVLDFGCGAGVITAWLNKSFPELTLNAVDVSALAVASTIKTIEMQGATVNAHLTDGLSEVTGTFNTIISNPPFHDGLKTRYDITEQFIAKSGSYFKRKGRLIIVANTFLQYPDIIQNTFGHCYKLGKNNKFSVYSNYE